MTRAGGIDEREHGASDRLIRCHLTHLPVGGFIGQCGHGGHRHRGLLGEAAPPLIVDTHDAAAGMLGGEQESLRLEVVLHVAVIVEVVVLQVRKCCDIEDNPVDPVQ